MRVIVYTGKGGVGKTSIAAATAVRAAELGHRTLVLSTDLAHSLADSLDLPLGPEPTEVAPLLWAQEPDVHHNMQTHWGTIQEWLKAALAWRGGVDGLVAEEVSIIPGMEPIVVTPQGDRFVVVVGERRLRAARRLKGTLLLREVGTELWGGKTPS